jgi:hypothetical protein
VGHRGTVHIGTGLSGHGAPLIAGFEISKVVLPDALAPGASLKRHSLRERASMLMALGVIAVAGRKVLRLRL